MSIIISKEGQQATKLERDVIHREDYLQQYIDGNPDCIPLHDLKENIRLLIVARDFTTPRGGCIDLLGVDADGEIYIVETKLAKTLTSGESLLKRSIMASPSGAIHQGCSRVWKIRTGGTGFWNSLAEMKAPC